MLQFIWDYQIFSYILFCSIFAYLVFKNYKRTKILDSKKKRISKLTVGSFFILGVLILIYGSIIEPRLMKITNIDINLRQTQKHEQLKIVHISDIHVGTYKKEQYIRRLADEINKIRPDLVVMTGDFILNNQEDAEYLRPLEKISRIYPTYAVTGNHEYNLGDWNNSSFSSLNDKTTTLRKVFDEIGVTLLENQTKLIADNQGSFYLIGIEDIWKQNEELKNNLEKITANLNREYPTILLSHNPDIIIQDTSAFDLILSGHTHGGQIRLPFIGSVMKLPTEISDSYDKGLFSLENGNQLFITSGVGESSPRSRLFCLPEIVVINLDL